MILFISNSSISKLTYGNRMRLAGGAGQGPGVRTALGNLLRMVITSAYTFVKIHQSVCLKSVHCVVCK